MVPYHERRHRLNSDEITYGIVKEDGPDVVYDDLSGEDRPVQGIDETEMSPGEGVYETEHI